MSKPELGRKVEMPMSDTSCRPPPGTTYLTIGQDLFSIQQYIQEQYNASLHSGSLIPMTALAPAAVMAYTDIQSLKGLSEPADYGSGVEYVQGLFDSFFVDQAVGLQLGLWLNGTEGCRQMLDGSLDNQIQSLFSYLQSCRAVKVFLRVGYEFDNPSFGYSSHPETFVKAFRMLVDVCVTQISWDCRDKVKFVWHSWGASPDIDFSRFYPGDDVVDWVGISMFQQVYPWSKSGVGGRLQDVEAVLDFAVGHDKPIMIAESTPFGGIDMSNKQTKKYSLPFPWERWFHPVLELIDRYDIAMWSYINCDWDSQPMWHGVGFGDTRLSSDRDVMSQWREHVLRGVSRPFLQSGTLDCSSGSMPLLEQALSSESSVDNIGNAPFALVPNHNTVIPARPPWQRLTEPVVHSTGVVVLVITMVFGWICWRRTKRNQPGAPRSAENQGRPGTDYGSRETSGMGEG